MRRGWLFDITSAVSTEGVATRRVVAQRAKVGTTGPFQVAQVPTARVTLGQPKAASIGSNRAGRCDTLRFAGAVSVPAAGDSLLTAKLLSPNGRKIGTFDQTSTFRASSSARAAPAGTRWPG